MKNRFKKYLSIVTMISVLFVQTMPVYAQTVTPTPVQSDPTPAPSQPPSDTPSDQKAETSTSPTPSPEAVTTPTPTEQVSSAHAQTAQPSTVQPQRTESLSDAEREQRREAAKAAWEQQFFTQHPELDKTNGSNGNTGSTTFKTGNATNSSVGVTSGNTNGINAPQNSAGSSGTAVVNPSASSASTSNVANAGQSGNGAASDNTSAVTNGAAVATDQTNSAKVGNNVNQSSVTGKSSTSFNVGDSTLTTGDANVSGTAVTGVNTNLSNVQVSEFNVIDNQKGDLILSPEVFAANCIAGCGSSAINSGNGALSTNKASISGTTDTNTTQINTAGIGNNLTLAANSGDNSGSFNTGGDTIINTGDANVSANSLTFANNNIAGGVTFGVVNIYGNLEGDIVLPEFASVGNSQNATQTSGNGALSTNTTSSDTTTNTNTVQNNDVTIANNVTVNGTTGGNSSSDNTTGNTTINTGKTTTDTNVLNITNTNVSDGTWWLVLVNHAGNWVGKLLGAPDGATMAGSSGTEFKTDENGQITATNDQSGSPQPSSTNSTSNVANAGQTGNGAASSNTSTVTSTTNTNTTQENTADIENNLNLSANTGGNKADFNTGGHNTINTGDSNIIANLVNFVNNNISGTGRLVVTVVNVFGSWTGDFVTPGQQKQNKQASSTPSSATQGSEEKEPVSPNNANSVPQQQNNNANTTGTGSVNNNDSHSGQTPQAGRTERIISGFKTTPQNTQQNFTENNNPDTVKVAGMTTTQSKTNPVKVAGTDEKIIRINLAWALLFLPLAVYGMLKRKNILLSPRKA